MIAAVRNITMKKLIVFLLCMIFIMTPVMSACQDTADTSSDGGNQSDTHSAGPGYNEETKRYEPNLPDYKWESDKEFVVCVYSNEVQNTYFSEDVMPDMYTTTDQALNEAVRDRNDKLYDRYKNVKIKAVAVKDVDAAIEADISGNTGDYDAAMPFLGSAVTRAQKHSYLDLRDYSEYIDFSMPWWDQNFLETMSIGDHVYFAVGDISIMQKIVSNAVIYNKNMLKEIDPSADLYQEVRDGEWTIDRMYELGKLAMLDNGDGVWDYNDRWGLYSSFGNPSSFYIAAGQSYVTKDSEGLPFLQFGRDSTITVAQNLLERFEEKDTWVEYVENSGLTGNEMWQLSVDVFGENRSLFYVCAFSAIKKLRNYPMMSDFGFLPMPKYNKEQDSYHTPCAGTYAFGVVIPSTAKDPEFSAFMIEAMCAEAKNTITPAYYETTLKLRDAKDPDSEEMLDEYIFSNINYDIGLLYNFGGVSSMLYDLLKNNSSDVASKFDSIKESVQVKIDEVTEFYLED